MGLGGLAGADFWGVAWAMIAAVAGWGLAAAAIAVLLPQGRGDVDEIDIGYNALAPFVDL
jgi:hypothetical protein